MRIPLDVVAALTLLTVAPAHADFVITATTTAPPAPVVPAPPTQPRSPWSGWHSPAAPHFARAAGFGQQVPLAFACRQIVPAGVKVTFGPGADPAALVDWKGGDTWNRTLLTALEPLGLRIIMRPMAIEIRK